ncbi:prephenate dehydrogenase [Chordicoccus furentiruminis]|uniref:prephenate dehydrogenase n=1 Tax=Chordicoccus furentiruminis TaxID=2709410 RepID=UPI0023A8F561|nr:prephenate dehydrogenase [Chordicoccus furentiruminis]
MDIGFIGLGLIGGSIAKTIRRVHPDARIIAYNRTASVLNDAVRDGTVDEACWEISGAFSSCDYVFLCTPVVTMLRQLKALKPYLRFGAIVTDVGSTKQGIHQAVHELGMDGCFIGGHPMAGSEKTGYENATDRMIENAWYILTPSDDVPLKKVSEFSAFISSLGALPLIMKASEHDYVTAATSHLPHIVSAALVNTVRELDGPEEYMRTIAAGGFKDITRISSSSPQMWQEICLANEDDLCIVLDRFIRKLTDFRFAIRNGNGEKLLEYFTECKTYRDSFSDDVRAGIRKENRIYLDIADRPGALAEVASVLAKNDISIENIGIVHNRDFEQGVLHIEFYDPEARTKAVKVLKENSYSVYEDK